MMMLHDPLWCEDLTEGYHEAGFEEGARCQGAVADLKGLEEHGLLVVEEVDQEGRVARV